MSGGLAGAGDADTVASVGGKGDGRIGGDDDDDDDLDEDEEDDVTLGMLMGSIFSPYKL